MHVSIDHTTTYRFDAPIGGALQELRLTPLDGPTQRVESWEVEVEGGTEQVTFADHHANETTLISLDAGVESATVRCVGTVETIDTDGVTRHHRGYAPRWLYLRSTELTTAGPNVERVVADLEHDPGDPIAQMHALSAHIRELVDYQPGWTHVATTAEDAVAAGRGVCQDHSHVFLAAARSLRVPARYVSGYLVMDGQTQQEATHAWVEAWVDGLGWLGLDVANGISPDERYVRLAVGLDYREAAPVSGIRYGEGDEHLGVMLQIQQ